MKVAITLNTSWNIYNFRMSLIQALIKDGHEVVAIAPHDEFTVKLIEAGCDFEDVTMDSRGASPIRDTGLTFELYNIYSRVRPDVILHYTIKPNIYGTLAAAILGIPVINNVSGLGTIFLNEDWISKIALSLYRFSFRFPKKVFFQNQEDYQLFMDKNLIQRNICEVIPGSGIDLDQFTPQPFREKKEGEAFEFLMISRLIIDKGIREYVAAAAILQERGMNAKFNLLGKLDELHSRGISSEELNDWIKEGYINYLGSTDDVRPFINKVDCVVLPSYREGTPRTLLEAAASAKPIVASNVPGCNNIVDHRLNGILCKVKDEDDLALKMKEMYYMAPDLRKEMGLRGREIVERRFDHNLVIERYLKAIDQNGNLKPKFKPVYVNNS
ncbi:Glycosyltransferase involved in cell wall bisynthesis [Marivirga sericea]|uniref:Glycosyltransferase involved in cell wall bisynthesis n=1 Tax=Marivirga sericea TaxID=1028 RepID=A0A1X7J236_9BACT|nr:glycosyltransferase family 4 protein [Marivirga sericea]SMG21615.1 Glycosyltransferase involved in cell wall bisynthesis [Marivirga sericea]